MLYHMTYKLYPATKKATLEAFGKMNAEMDAMDAGPDVKIICRLHDIGEGTGMVIADCKSAKVLQSWCYNWTGACELKAVPVCTDTEMRRVINKQPAKSEPTPDPLKFDDSMDIFYMTWKIDRPHIAACMGAYGAMSPEADKADAGENNMLVRVGNMGDGTGCCVFQSPSAEVAAKWAYNWAPMCELKIKTMLTDAQAREIISSKSQP